jgi:hypothetical protein
MWYVQGAKGHTELKTGIPVKEGKASAERIATHLRNFGWSNVRVVSD